MSKIMDWNVAIRMELFVDNKSTIDSAKHHVSHGRSKHIEKKLKLETKNGRHSPFFASELSQLQTLHNQELHSHEH
ncbi:hypothetical protein MTR_6g022680 [Medicago truncatula]|uniref:Uncharacterized protein n=1 Tax=Medicago truncatula TaxID=3880 RepID=A0A072U8K9_MEDTR|nr:hypothetical protein MTR_6g022680 [Medicago truncatula]